MEESKNAVTTKELHKLLRRMVEGGWDSLPLNETATLLLVEEQRRIACALERIVDALVSAPVLVDPTRVNMDDLLKAVKPGQVIVRAKVEPPVVFTRLDVAAVGDPRYGDMVNRLRYPVDYSTDTALHPFVGDGDLCAGCGEHRSWHEPSDQERCARCGDPLHHVSDCPQDG